MTAQEQVVRGSLGQICSFSYTYKDKEIKTEALLKRIEGEYCICERKGKEFKFEIANLFELH